MIEKVGSYQFRYCHDVETPGKVRVYVEQRPAGANEHLIPSTGVPPHICFKDGAQPSSGSEAREMARKFANCSENARRGRGFHE